MALVTEKPNESLDSMLRRFKRKVENEGIIKCIRSKQEYLKPSEKAKKKREEAQKMRNKKNKSQNKKGY